VSRGSCSTAQLRTLKGQYKASGVALKRAIDADPRALYLAGELDPFRPQCGKSLFRSGLSCKTLAFEDVFYFINVECVFGRLRIAV
jgi:hypothetical protein